LTNRPSEKIFFLHIPKCGGVSVGQAIAVKYLSLNLRNDSGVINLNAPVSRQVVEATEGLHYPHDTDDDYPLLNFREKLLLYFMAQPNSRFISGHFLFSKIAYQKHGGKFSFVTILRDPVKRWISSYFYNIFKASDHMKVNDEIDARLESHFGISQGYELVKFLGGANKEGDYTSPKAIDRATENLKRFEVVGFLENLSDFTEKFYARFHVKLQIAKKNQNPAPIQYQKSIITHELLERITDVCQPDIQVYEYAIQHFGDQEY
jgi:hypothetical protein